MIKKIIPFSVKAKLLLRRFQSKPLQALSFKPPKQTEKRAYIFLAADYGNLGDVAITYAQHKFLQNLYPDYLITEIPISKTIEGIAFVKKILSSTDVVTTVGGGNMGDLYPMIEHFRQMVISNFKSNRVISFPQTIDFGDTHIGRKSLKKAIKVYSKHPNLILLAREQKSYDFFKKHFTTNTIIKVPDIVLTLDKTAENSKRDGAIICLRDDKEKKLNPDQEKKLLSLVKEKFGGFTSRDTHIGGANISLNGRVKALEKIWSDFRRAEVVITDRLHGMIFCYITNTPALVFLNNNHKIKSSYAWIDHAKHIRLMENFSKEDINESLEFLKTQKVTIKKDLLPQYTELKKIISSKD
ncbi:polysaccharide pyruvyl transferase family protein [Flagellimonas sp. 389]|uniref:polysaccharide pyruvyl transferase family protein n=1 Tax=Flagellimonas sp. 389 TaxID=2835862 RepID=UPI001BD49D07|nr:polysaccharide pyruvyl transferase family protein [Flagellimonas sp. 389]MBS9462197.1 polysaccharide pyruvyl transferase family protein [Flagellimonas sp. 389]